MNNSKRYVVAQHVRGRWEYLAFDSASGGYPYLSNSIREITFVLSNAVKWLKSMEKEYPDMRIYEICLEPVELPKASPLEQFKALTEAEQRRLLEYVGKIK
jgi:hypothetical protein